MVPFCRDSSERQSELPQLTQQQEVKLEYDCRVPFTPNSAFYLMPLISSDIHMCHHSYSIIIIHHHQYRPPSCHLGAWLSTWFTIAYQAFIAYQWQWSLFSIALQNSWEKLSTGPGSHHRLWFHWDANKVSWLVIPCICIAEVRIGDPEKNSVSEILVTVKLCSVPTGIV